MRILFVAILAVVPILSGCGVPSYDKARYDKMEQVIIQSTNMLQGLTLSEASKLLSLEGVQWDEGYSNVGQDRIYHFPGFCLRLSLESHPSLRNMQSSNSVAPAQVQSNGTLWVGAFWPHLEIDRLHDPRTRMSNYWDNVQASFRRHGAETKFIEARLPAETNK